MLICFLKLAVVSSKRPLSMLNWRNKMQFLNVLWVRVEQNLLSRLENFPFSSPKNRTKILTGALNVVKLFVQKSDLSIKISSRPLSRDNFVSALNLSQRRRASTWIFSLVFFASSKSHFYHLIRLNPQHTWAYECTLMAISARPLLQKMIVRNYVSSRRTAFKKAKRNNVKWHRLKETADGSTRQKKIYNLDRYRYLSQTR